jgi:hypothetical protein
LQETAATVGVITLVENTVRVGALVISSPLAILLLLGSYMLHLLITLRAGRLLLFPTGMSLLFIMLYHSPYIQNSQLVWDYPINLSLLWPQEIFSNCTRESIMCLIPGCITLAGIIVRNIYVPKNTVFNIIIINTNTGTTALLGPGLPQNCPPFFSVSFRKKNST